MAERTRYKTKQKDQLTAYLRDRSGVHVTAAEIHNDFQNRGVTMGMATIYRHLDQLVADGLVRKYIIGATGSACFEYVGERADDMIDCFHCKCEKCGKLIHLHCEELTELGLHLKDEHQFTLDPRRTVFYGVCEECSSEYSRDAKKR